MKLYTAPVQGHTDAAWRHFHEEAYATGSISFTPFIRLEQGALRPRDLKDFTSPLNGNQAVIPQVIFRDKTELESLIRLLRENGASRIDLNMGCPFPLQTGHGRGAATIANRELGATVEQAVADNPDVVFSVKMRLGLNDPDEWRSLLPFLNNTRLSHVTLHPRIGRQQYSGQPDLVNFGAFRAESKNPVVYNGDILTPADAEAIVRRFPGIEGIMVGRGLLGRPSLINEIARGEEWPREKRVAEMVRFHRNLLRHYTETLCGESQILGKIKPFWEYAETEIGRKAWKSIKKATNLAKYHSAVAMIEV